MKVFTVMLMVLMMSGLVRAANIEDLERKLRDIKTQVADQERRIIRLEGRGQVNNTIPLESQFTNGNERWKELKNWKKIVSGMSRRQVESILGQPTSVKTDSSFVTLMYQGDSTNSGYISGNVLVNLADDRVIIVNIPVM